MSDEKDNPTEIFLQPECCADPAYGRAWCRHDAPVECEDGEPWTRYVLADAVDALSLETVRATIKERDAAFAENTTLKARLAELDGTVRYVSAALTKAQERLAEITEQRDIAEANLARLQERWDARPATDELEARLAEAERLLRQQVTDTCPPDWGAQAASFLATGSAASQPTAIPCPHPDVAIIDGGLCACCGQRVTDQQASQPNDAREGK